MSEQERNEIVEYILNSPYGQYPEGFDDFDIDTEIDRYIDAALNRKVA